MTRRPGSTLIEVLVAMFVMGIGMIALLTLFPLGALLMAQAIRDDRCAQAGWNAHAISIAQNIRNDLLVGSGPDPGTGNPISDLFANPALTVPTANPYNESYAILADPIGVNSVPSIPNSSWDWVGNYAGLLRRRPVSFTATKLDIYKSFTLWDDITFDRTTNPGAPQKVASSIFRDARFSWAYLLQRPQTRDTSVVNCSIVVFDSRPLSLTGTLTLSEYVFPSAAGESVVFDRTTNTITLTTALPPPIRPGNWIYETTTPAGEIRSCFYRVVAVDEFAGNVIRYEVQQPIRPLLSNPALTSYSGRMIVMEGIVEVFDKGPARLP